MCIIFHKWGRWEPYETISLSSFYSIPCKSTQVRQARCCFSCGKVQDEFVVAKDLILLTKNNIPKENTTPD